MDQDKAPGAEWHHHAATGWVQPTGIHLWHARACMLGSPCLTGNTTGGAISAASFRGRNLPFFGDKLVQVTKLPDNEVKTAGGRL